ncbi:hypothetical protein [Halolamina salifodinae]|uniref:Uncharacterized protein n=1 Tax=Halolamina salifodinae TaxID=1202767 RepID=A0A8T4GZT7_9EURY|nr:hypothetical protein [Halolamina salifodinae]MBP1987633.1 hypothetical protein [Halolamina salifodinae]
MTTKSFTTTSGIPTNRELSGDVEGDNSSASPYARSDEFADERLAGNSSAPALNNATYIGVHEDEYQSKASWKQIKKYERLELYNRGTHTRQGRVDQTQLHDQDDWYFCESLTAQMGLSDYEWLLTLRLFKPMDMRTYRGTESDDSKTTMKQYLGAFCVGALVYNAGQSDNRWMYYPGTESGEKIERYNSPKARFEVQQVEDDLVDRHQAVERCAESLDFSEGEIRSCLEKVRTELPAWVDDG